MTSGLSHERLKSLLHYDPDAGVFTWRVRCHAVNVGDVAGSKAARGRWRITVDRKEHQAHRLAWFYVHGVWPKNEIDHINRIADDNRIANLREATRSQNQCNTGASKRNRFGVKGVAWNAQMNKFQVSVAIGGQRRYLGLYESLEEAGAVYAAAAEMYHGEFAGVRTSC